MQCAWCTRIMLSDFDERSMWNIKTIFISNHNNNRRRWITKTTAEMNNNKPKPGNEKNVGERQQQADEQTKKLLYWSWSEQTQMTFIIVLIQVVFEYFLPFPLFNLHLLHFMPLHVEVYGFLACVVESFPFPYTHFICQFGFVFLFLRSFIVFYCSFRCICAMFLFKKCFFCSFENVRFKF